MQQKMSEIDEVKTQEFSLIHGELTPPHVFILENGEIGLIDIEGAKYFDIEYEWAIINLIYGNKIPLPKSINNEKLKFYKLYLKVGDFSVATDYLMNVDGNDKWFRDLRESNMNDLKNMISGSSP